jgi:hypothetical protein
MTEVRGPGAKCSTGQRRPNYSKKESQDKKERTTTLYTTREERRETQIKPNYQKERSEHLPRPP